MNVCSLINAMVAKKRSDQPKRGVMWLPPTVAQLVVLLVDLHHSWWVRPALVVIPNREGSKQISKPVPN